MVVLWKECGWTASRGVDADTVSVGSRTLSASLQAHVIQADTANLDLCLASSELVFRCVVQPMFNSAFAASVEFHDLLPPLLCVCAGVV